MQQLYDNQYEPCVNASSNECDTVGGCSDSITYDSDSRFCLAVFGGMSATQENNCQHHVCQNSTDNALVGTFTDMQNYEFENSEKCSNHGTCKASSLLVNTITPGAFDCTCQTIKGFTGEPTGTLHGNILRKEGLCDKCLDYNESQQKYSYPKCKLYNTTYCGPKCSDCPTVDHPACSAIVTLEQCSSLSNVSLTSGVNFQPYWFLCQKKCGHCRIDGKFASLCPTTVTRDMLLDDIHGEWRSDVDTWQCQGPKRFFNNISPCTFDTSQITDFSNMFKKCTDVDFSSILDWTVSAGTTFDSMFAGSTFSGSLKQWDFSSLVLNASNFKIMFNFDADNRHSAYYNLHMLDFMPANNLTFSQKTGTVPSDSPVLTVPPCWYHRVNNTVTLAKCNSGIDNKGASCSFKPTYNRCTDAEFDELKLPCKTVSDRQQSLKIITSLCPTLNQGFTQNETPCESNQGQNCIFACNDGVYDTSDCSIDFNDDSTSFRHAELVCQNDVFVGYKNRMQNASNYCGKNCRSKTFNLQGGAQTCSNRADCVGLHVTAGCDSATLDKLRADSLVSLCTELEATGNSGSLNTCVLNYSEIGTVLQRGANDDDDAFDDDNAITEFNFNLLPKSKSVAPVVIVSVIFAWVVVTHLFVLIKQ